MRSSIATIAVFITFAMSSPVIAQISYTTKDTRQIIYIFGTCVVKHRPSGASKAVLSQLDKITLRMRYARLIDGSCVAPGVSVRFPGDYFIYALADALVARELTGAPVPDLSKVPPLENGSTTTFTHLKRKFGYDAALWETRDAEVFGALNVFGECVVRQNPTNAKALLMVEPESPIEPARFQALQPAFSTCAADKTMELSKTVLRGTIALNYYRLAQAALHVPVR